MITKEQFEKLVDIELTEKDGKLVYDGNLFLKGRKDITELPDNFKVLGFLELSNSGITKLPKGLEVEYWLDISGTEIEELPKDTKADCLYTNKMKKPFSFPKIVKVNSSFECSSTTIKRIPEKLYVKEYCDFSGSTFDKLPEVMDVKSNLYLECTSITELPKGLKEVYGTLDMRYTNVTTLNDNLVVYNTIILGYTQIEELTKGFIVGGLLNLCRIDLKDYSKLQEVCSEFIVTKEKYKEIEDTLAEHSKETVWDEVFVTFEPNYKGAYLFKNEIGKYIKADGIFGKIVKQKGNVYHIQIGSGEEITYLVTDGEGRWSHGETLDEAKADLIYKVSNKNKDDYKDLTLDSELSFEGAIMCYRVITGACLFGTRNYIENRLGENRKDKYTIKEIINLTNGEYGNKVFKEFFCEN